MKIYLTGADMYVRTDGGVPLLPDNHGALHDGRARVVDAVEHRLYFFFAFAPLARDGEVRTGPQGLSGKTYLELDHLDCPGSRHERLPTGPSTLSWQGARGRSRNVSAGMAKL